MSHKLTSTKSVIYNSETQAEGILEIHAEQVIFQNDGNNYHNVYLQMPVKSNSTGEYVSSLNFNVSGEEWSDFYSSSAHLLSPDTGNYDEVIETALHYTRVKIDGKWGLLVDDWTFS
jgi:hypothetical protein